MDKPLEAVAWWMDEPVADDDPLAAVKHRARAHVDGAEVLAEVTRSAEVVTQADRLDEVTGLLTNESFDLGATWDAGLDAGLSELDLDAAETWR